MELLAGRAAALGDAAELPVDEASEACGFLGQTEGSFMGALDVSSSYIGLV